MNVISRYSDKCDFADHIEIFGVENVLKADIYVGDTKIDAKGYNDLIPYLPHIICISCGSKDGGSYIKLTEKSQVDIHEEETLGWYLRDLLKIYNRCKRKKIEFNVEDAVKEVCWNNYNKEIITNLANRVKEHGKKATIDGLHTFLNEYYRENLVDEMLKYGLNPADWDYGRFVKESE